MHHITLTLLGILLLPLLTIPVHANVEKTIFLGPPATTIPSEAPDLDDLGLERLTPQNGVVRTQVNASFPSAEAPDGTESWFFLENLTPGQRYEVRICWLATVGTYLFLRYITLQLQSTTPSRPDLSIFNSTSNSILTCYILATNILHPHHPPPPNNPRRPNLPHIPKQILRFPPLIPRHKPPNKRPQPQHQRRPLPGPRANHLLRPLPPRPRRSRLLLKG